MVLDCGDTFSKAKNVPRLRADCVLAGMKLMAYDAINMGEGELSLGCDYFDLIRRKTGLLFVSANISIDGCTASALQPYIIKEYGDVTVGITGITPSIFFDQSQVNTDGITISDPLAGLKDVLAEMRRQTDIVILLSHLSYEGTTGFLQMNALPDIDVVIAGHGRKILRTPKKINGTILVQSSMGGEFLGKLVLRFGEDGEITDYQGELIALTDSMPENKEALVMMKTFKKDKTRQLRLQREAKDKKKILEKTQNVLKMHPQAFLDMMKKQNAEASADGKPQRIPLTNEPADSLGHSHP